MRHWRALAFGVLLAFPVVAAEAQQPPHARLVAQLGHRELVSSVAFSPDGKTIVTASWDKTARLWEAASGKELRVLDGHSNEVYTARFSPDGRQIVTASGDGTIRTWEAATGKQLLRIKGHGERMWSAVFSPDGRQILTGEWDDIAVLYDAATGKEVRRFTGHTASVFAAVFSADGKFVLTGSQDKTARLWDAATGKELRRFVNTEQINAVAISPDGRYVLTGCDREITRLWDAQTGSLLHELLAPVLAEKDKYKSTHAVGFSPDSRWALTVSNDDTRVWDTTSGTEVRRFPDSAGWSGTFSPDGKAIWAGTYSYKVLAWDVATGAQLGKLEGSAVDVMSVAVSSDGSKLLTGGRDELAHLWGTTNGQEVGQLKGHTGVVTSVKFSPDGKTLLTGGDSTARMWDASTGVQLKVFQQTLGCMSVGYWLTSDYVLSGNMDGTAELWETKSGDPIQQFDSGPNGKEIANNWVVSVSIVPDGKTVLTGSWDGTARLWDALSGKELRRMKTPERLNSAVISPQGLMVLTASDDNLARIWEPGSEKEVVRFAGHTAPVYAAVFSPDEKTVLTGSWDKTARLWDAATGKELHRLEGHTMNVQSVAFTPDGTRAITGSLDGTTRVWDVATGKELASLISFANGRWAVVDPEGRFDTSDLDGGASLQWVVDDAPFHALPLEIFMRDYYTPGLLARVMRGEKLPPVRSIAEIKNRVQPRVTVEHVTPSETEPNRVDVVVQAESITDKGVNSGLQDLRLFRDGQMVANGYREGPLKDGGYVFQNVMLKSDAKKATFTAYAFNSERIKSATSAYEYEVKTPATTAVKRRAFLLQVGVNHTSAAGCELSYSVNDAEKMSAALSERLETQRFEVVAVKLESPTGSDATGAAKDSIHDTLNKIAAAATPDDSFFMSFSGHGYAAADGMFYILPSNLEGSCQHVDAKLLRTAISADELADWLRPIDAGELTLILDACHSAESVQAGDFRPGPMGSRGLGQAAYDKRMRVLAASQSDAVAYEFDYLHQGLLSYVLVQDGLGAGKADWKPKDGKITVGEWLSYAAAAVPQFKPSTTNSANKGTTVEKTDKGTKQAGQVPALFDFSHADTLVLTK